MHSTRRARCRQVFSTWLRIRASTTDVECDDDDYNFYFNTKNGSNGQGYTGEKDNYLYFNGKRLEADDDYRLYYLGGDIYLVNNKGKIQSSKSDNKKFDLENKGIAEEDVNVQFTGKKVKSVKLENGTEYSADELIKEAEDIIKSDNFDPSEDYIVSIPFIQLYDDDVYTSFYTIKADGSEFKLEDNGETWVGMNK